MAIELIKELLPTMVVHGYLDGDIQNSYTHQTPFMAGYNMQVVKWKSDSVSPPVKGKIEVNDYEFDNLFSLSDGIFSFNIQEAINTILGNFDDNFDYNTANWVVYDDNLLKKITVILSVLLEDETIETQTITAYVTRAVHQIGDKNAECMVSFDPTAFTTSVYSTQVMHKYDNLYRRTSDYEKQQYLKLFKGYPFDICILDKLDTVKIRMELTTKDVLTSLGTVDRIVDAAAADKYLKRLVLSDGETMLTPLTETEAVLKVTTITAANETNSIYQVEVDIIDECGIYLKWLNSEGGWSYHLFNKYYKIPFSAKTKGKINKYNDTLIGAVGNQTNIGQTVTTGIKINQRFLNTDDYTKVVEIASSPIVYLYNEPKGTMALSDSWIQISLDDFKDDYRDNKKKIFDISFLFTLPNNYTQSL